MTEEMKHHIDMLEQDLAKQTATIAALEKRLAEAEAVIRPFVEEFKTWDTHTPVDEYYCEGDPAVFKFEDLERAAAWLDGAK